MKIEERDIHSLSVEKPQRTSHPTFARPNNCDIMQASSVFSSIGSYGPDTIDFLLESVSFFTQLGVSVIHLNPNICMFWGENAYSYVYEW